VSRAYLIIIIPAAIVAVFYVAMFRGLGFDLSAWPFLGTAVLFGGALIAVLRYQRRKQKRRDS
jgi:ABC-type spermidine/putrescine transport system permease subunit II